MVKTFGPASEGDIAVFETDEVQGFAMFGYGRKPNQAFAQVFSKNQNVSQGILINSGSLEESKKALLSLLASFRYKISKVPTKDDLHDMIMREISKHDKFENSES